MLLNGDFCEASKSMKESKTNPKVVENTKEVS